LPINATEVGSMSLLLPHRRRNSGAKGAMSTERRRTGSSTTCCAVDWTTREAEVGALGLLIYQAAKEGSTEGLKFALSRRGARVHIDYRDSNTKYTPLMAAAANGHLHCVKLLLSHSADIKFSIPGPKSRSTKQTALSLADKHGHNKVAEYLQACLGKQLYLWSQVVYWFNAIFGEMCRRSGRW
jgi:hypothetical protein